MDDVVFNCMNCGQPLEASIEMLGKTLPCPACKVNIRVPGTPDPKTQAAIDALAQNPTCKITQETICYLDRSTMSSADGDNGDEIYAADDQIRAMILKAYPHIRICRKQGVPPEMRTEDIFVRVEKTRDAVFSFTATGPFRRGGDKNAAVGPRYKAIRSCLKA